MKREEKVAIVRILTELIKADAIIDAGEMEKYAELKDKYNISKEDEIQSANVTLAEALVTISESDRELKSGLYADCVDMTVSDGYCARSEALLMNALRVIIEYDLCECAQLISILKPTFNITSSSVLNSRSQQSNSATITFKNKSDYTMTLKDIPRRRFIFYNHSFSRFKQSC